MQINMDILERIQSVGAKGRRTDNLVRRALKTSEEVGELAEAALSVTSVANAKEKQWHDVIEEAVDVAIMGLDIAMTKPKEWDHISDENWRLVIIGIMRQKLEKWESQIDSGTTLIDEQLPSFDSEEQKESFQIYLRSLV